MDFFSPFKSEYLVSLDTYKHTGNDRSLLYQYVTSPIQNRLVEFLPEWLAPNVITLLGLLSVVLSACISLFFSPRFENTDVPGFVFVLNGLLLLAYRFLDDMDGKQARRTQSSSPLGELFDHGCDALTGTIAQIPFLVILASGTSFYTFFLVLVINVNYVFEDWAQYYTGKMEFWYINSINEGVMFAVLFQIIGGFLGGQLFFHSTLSEYLTFLDFFPFNTLRICDGVVWVGLMTTIYTIVSSVVKVYDRDIIKKIPGIFPSSYVLFIFGSWVAFRPLIFDEYPIMFLITFVFMFGYEISYITLSFVLKMPLRKYSLPHITLSIVFLVQCIPIIDPKIQVMVFLGLTVQTLIVYTWFAVSVTLKISKYLDINVFTIKKKSVQRERHVQVAVFGGEGDDAQI